MQGCCHSAWGARRDKKPKLSRRKLSCLAGSRGPSPFTACGREGHLPATRTAVPALPPQAGLWMLSSCPMAACWSAMMRQAQCTVLPTPGPPSVGSWGAGVRMATSRSLRQVARGWCQGYQPHVGCLGIPSVSSTFCIATLLLVGLLCQPFASAHHSSPNRSHTQHRERLRRQPGRGQRAGLPALCGRRCVPGRRPQNAAGHLTVGAEQPAGAPRGVAVAQLRLHPWALRLGGLWPAGEPGQLAADVWCPGLCCPAGAQGTHR